jgi:NAD-dependent deacetylase
MNIEALCELLLSSNYTVVLTGAGMSTESGIPDFNSPKIGIYEVREFYEIDTPRAIRESQSKFTDFFRWCLRELDKYKPNKGHEILAKWEEKGLVKGIITQNVEEFHQMAGSKNVLEMHGSIRKIRCSDCERVFTAEDYLRSEKPTCECGGILRPSVVLFHEPVMELDSVYQEIQRADLLIVLGTSLRVYPAAALPGVVHSGGGRVVIINRDPTDSDHLADIVINDRGIGEVLEQIDDNIEVLRKNYKNQ